MSHKSLYDNQLRRKIKTRSKSEQVKDQKLQATFQALRAINSEKLPGGRKTSLDSDGELKTSFALRVFNTSDTITSQLAICAQNKQNNHPENLAEVSKTATTPCQLISHSSKAVNRIPIQEFLESDCGTSLTSECDSDSGSELPFEQNFYQTTNQTCLFTENKSRLPLGTPLSTALNMVHLPSEIASMNELGDKIDSIEQLPKLQHQESGLTRDSEKRKSHVELESPTNKTNSRPELENRYRKISCGY